MEELNKNQVVLLVLLVSFVTSIATGIVTVTLLQQAPPGVTQTINRVVERTIEKTVPGETKTTTVIKEVPVIVTEEQLIVDVINSASPATVRITDRSGVALGTGFIISDDGRIATVDKVFLTGPTINDSYQIFLGDGRHGDARLIRTDAKKSVVLLQLVLASLRDGDGKDASKAPLVKLDLVETEVLPGQTVVALGVPDNGPINVSGGIVSGLFKDTVSGTSFINTSASNLNNIGGPLLNTKGKVIGLSRDAGVAVTAAMIGATNNSILK
ncbi:trypsin-like peptidase domain-containing protein [Candidatus Nomurabacteria bacterium]|nr:trypsin-like peptidase domain-containing protein [Candidatus Nomurabacteria bacterium]